MLATYSWELFYTESHFLQVNIMMVFYAIWKKNHSLQCLPCLLCPSTPWSIFFPPPTILLQKEIKLFAGHLVPDFQSNKFDLNISFSCFSIPWQIACGLAVGCNNLSSSGETDSSGVVCNLQPTYFLPLLCFPLLYFCFFIEASFSFFWCVVSARSWGVWLHPRSALQKLRSPRLAAWMADWEQSGRAGLYEIFLLSKVRLTSFSVILITALVTCILVCSETQIYFLFLVVSQILWISVLGAPRYPSFKTGCTSSRASRVTMVDCLPMGTQTSVPIPGLVRFPGVGSSLQYSSLENSVDRGALEATVLVLKSRSFKLQRRVPLHSTFLLALGSELWKWYWLENGKTEQIRNPHLPPAPTGCFPGKILLSDLILIKTKSGMEGLPRWCWW